MLCPECGANKRPHVEASLVHCSVCGRFLGNYGPYGFFPAKASIEVVDARHVEPYWFQPRTTN